MLSFIIQKIKNTKWMTASLLLGGILLFSVVAAIPMYSDASLQAVLTESIRGIQAEKGVWPGSIQTEVSIKTGAGRDRLEGAETSFNRLVEELGLDVLSRSETRTTFTYRLEALSDRKAFVRSRNASLRFKTDVESHVELIRGEMFSPALAQDGALEVIVNAASYGRMDLMLGETYEYGMLSGPDGEPLRVRVVGVFKMADENDTYWRTSPEAGSDVLYAAWELMPEILTEDFYRRFSVLVDWEAVVDTDGITIAGLGDAEELIRRAGKNADNIHFALDIAFAETVLGMQSQVSRYGVMLWLLLVPILVMMGLFLFMVCREILEQEKPTISVLKSRGYSRSRVVIIYALQSALIGLAAALPSLPLGYFICRVIGSANGFLDLVSRTALPVRFTVQSLGYMGIAYIAFVGVMTIPAIEYSRESIVGQKRAGSRNGKANIGTFAVSGAGVLIGLYALYSFGKQKESLLVSGAEKGTDLLMYFAASIFLLGAGVLVALLLPQLLRLVFRLGKKQWNAPIYAALLRSQRATSDQRFLMVFLVLTIAVGIFSSTMARTINRDAEDNSYYSNGAQIVLMQDWWTYDEYNNKTLRQDFPTYDAYEALDREREDVTITRVLNSDNYYVAGKDVSDDEALQHLKLPIHVMGIETQGFGEVAWMREDLLPIHFNRYLNALTQDASAVLLSSNCREYVELGDTIEVRNDEDKPFVGKVYGFVDHWPTSFSDGSRVSERIDKAFGMEFLIIGNLSQMQNAWGVEPYELWIDTEEPDILYDFAEEHHYRYAYFLDTQADLVDTKNDPTLQGTNGVLTVGFILVLVVCMVGFLIYWVLSIRSRTLQFGIFRAIGMPMRNLMVMLGAEQIFVSLTSVAAGTGVGILASRLYVPMIQMSFSPERSLPLLIVTETGDYIRLFGMFGAALVICIAALVMLVRRIRIAQALKLGEDG